MLLTLCISLQYYSTPPSRFGVHNIPMYLHLFLFLGIYLGSNDSGIRHSLVWHPQIHHLLPVHFQLELLLQPAKHRVHQHPLEMCILRGSVHCKFKYRSGQPPNNRHVKRVPIELGGGHLSLYMLQTNLQLRTSCFKHCY